MALVRQLGAAARAADHGTSTCWWRWSSTTCCCPMSRCDATSPTRRRSSWSPTPSATRMARAARTRSRSPIRRRRARRRGERGRRNSSTNSWRACAHVLGGGEVEEATWTLFPDAETLARMATGWHHVRTDDDGSRWCTATCRLVQPGRRGAVDARSRRVQRPGALRRATAGAGRHGRLRVPGACATRPTWIGSRYGAISAAPCAVSWRSRRGSHERARTYRRRRPTQAAQPGPPA